MNAHVQIRQISQYTDKDPVFPDDRVVIQEGGLGGPYRSATVQNLVGTALMLGGDLKLAPGARLVWEGGLNATLTWDGGSFFFGSPVAVPSLSSCGSITMGGHMLATIDDLNGFINNGSVWSFNGRTGEVVLSEEDILRAGAAPVRSPCFSGWVTAPSPCDVTLADNTVVTANWVQRLLGSQLPPLTTQSPVLGDSSNRIATTAFVDDTLEDYAPLYSPAFTGKPSAPAPAPGNSSNQIATTSFVAATAGNYLPLSGGTLTGSVNMTAGSVYKYNGANLAYIVPNASGDNTFFGESGNISVTGNSNVGNGVTALHNITTGSNNIGIGYFAISTETTGGNNVAIGRIALGTQNGATFNTAVGYSAGFDLTTGGNNAFFGGSCGRGITTGSSNTVIGYGLTGLPSALSGALILGAGAAVVYDYNSTTTAIHTFSAAVRLSKGYTVATLPAGKPVGTTAYVTDGTAALGWGVTVTGGGSTPYLVWYNGSAWTVVGK